MEIQPASGYVSPIAVPGDSITELAQQHGVSRESLLEFVRSKIQQTRRDNGEPPLDQATLDRAISQTLDDAPKQPGDGAPASGGEEPAPASYTSTARSVAVRTAASSISVFA